MKPEQAYVKIVEWDDEDKIYIGSAPPLVGRCCHGSTEASVLKQLAVIVPDVIEMLKREGIPLPEESNKEYSGKFLVRVKPEIHRVAALKASQLRKSLNAFVEAALEGACMAQPAPKTRRKATA